jgi:hypothetical protein
MAQDPEPGPTQEGEDLVDPSHDLDVETLYSSLSIDAEMEADMIRGILESNGIPSTMVRSSVGALGYVVQVPHAYVQEAERLIQEAQAAGPDAATEAEAASEEGQ